MQLLELYLPLPSQAVKGLDTVDIYRSLSRVGSGDMERKMRVSVMVDSDRIKGKKGQMCLPWLLSFFLWVSVS